MKVLRSLWIVLAALTVALTQAQYDAMGMAQKMRTSPLALMAMGDIRKELKLTGDQNKQVEQIQKDHMKKMADLQKAARAEGTAGFMGLSKSMQEETDKSSQAILALFTPEQSKRFTEIQLQVAGPISLGEPELQKALALTPDQIAKVEQIKKDANDKIMALVQPGQRNASGSEMMKKLKAIHVERDAALLKLLTDEQAAKYKELQGTPSPAAKKLADTVF